jgi:hypothetical protein
MNDAQKIDALQREVERLRSELARYKPQPVIARPDGPFVLPNEEMVEKLVSRVFKRYPNLRNDIAIGGIKPDEFVTMTRSAMLYISTLSRMRGAVHRQRDYMDWLFQCSDFLNRGGHGNADIRGSSFFVAAVAAGDVWHTPPALWPHTRDVGLLVGHRVDSYRATNAWLRVAAGDFNTALVIAPPAATLHSPRTQFEVAKDWRGELIISRAGGQAAWTNQHGVSRTVLNKVLNGRGPPTKSITRALKLRTVFVSAS